MWKTLCAIIFGALGFSLVTITTGWNSPTSNISFDNPISLNDLSLTMPARKIEKSLKKATLLLEQGEIVQAMNIIKMHEKLFDYETSVGRQWLDLYISASIASRDYPQLIALFQRFPESFWANEEASLHLGNALITAQNADEYSLLRHGWRGKESRQQEWLFLDVDTLLLSNQNEEAIKMLQSNCLAGTEDCQRLVRLALLSVNDNPKVAWEYLTEAGLKDPQNPDIHTYRARLLESVGKNALALSEYTSAVNTAPSNIFLKDQLADFYLRHGQFPHARSVWLETLNGPTLDTIWLKAVFWSRMISPITFKWSTLSPPVGKSHAFNLYLLGLEADQFWNESLFDKIPNAQVLLETQQATFWMRLLDHLKNRRENSALKLIEANIFADELWDSSLERALHQILTYRKTGKMPVTDDASKELEVTKIAKAYNAQGNPFFAALNRMSNMSIVQDGVNVELKSLIDSDEAFAAAFISAGWLEAGLQLHAMAKYPDEFPDWATASMIEAISSNHSPEGALKFAMEQPLSPRLAGVVDVLLKLSKDDKSMLDKLQVFSQESTEKGIKASWLLSLIYIEKGEPLKAKQTIMAQGKFADSVIGKESLARIALLENYPVLATSFYESIEDVSSEAKSYLAWKAYTEKKWERARQLTEALLKIYPDNSMLKENLHKISEEEKVAVK
ncbi:MAG: hypothetical protein H0W50_03320 [Parachlamydiaceae bacterium]|nr:hypothetical protein [Parachlamydiaceae bacterium]